MFKLKLVLLGIFALVIVTSSPDHPVEATSGAFGIMPSRYASGGNVTDAGLHFDDGALAAYDYGGSTDAWLRGTVTQSLSATRQYMYWPEGSCRVRARLRLWDPWTSSWYVEYSADIDILHLTSRPAGTEYSQNFVTAGDWFYKVVGTASTCGTIGAHSHLAVTLTSYVAKTYKSGDTCWGTTSQCSAMGGQSVKTHANNSYYPYDECPGQWSGSYASNRSGGASAPNYNPYACQGWSYIARSDQDAVFTVTFP